MRVCVHCAVLEEQPPRTLGSRWGLGVLGGWLSHCVTAVIASRKRPVPFRTRKLSSIAPMVLHSGGCGRVGRRRTSLWGVGVSLRPFKGFRSSHSLFSCPKSGSSFAGLSRWPARAPRNPWPRCADRVYPSAAGRPEVAGSAIGWSVRLQWSVRRTRARRLTRGTRGAPAKPRCPSTIAPDGS